MLTQLVDDQDELLAAIQAAGELSPDGCYGLAQSLAGETQGIDESTCSASFVIVTNEQQNRNGNGHILTKNEYGQGMMTKMHQRNPVVLWDHGMERSLPIALASAPTASMLKTMAKGRQDVARMIEQNLSPATIDAAIADYEQQLVTQYSRASDLGAYSVRIEEAQATSTAWFNQSDEFSMQIFGMVAQGYVRMASIGFQARKGLPLKIDEGRRKMSAAIDFNAQRAGFQFVETELHEWSVVTIGADRGSFRQCIERGKIGQERLGSHLKSYLQRIVDLEKEQQSSVTVAGVDIPQAAAVDTAEQPKEPSTQAIQEPSPVVVPVAIATQKPVFDPMKLLCRIRRSQKIRQIARDSVSSVLVR